MWHLQRQALQSKACQALKVVTILQHLLGFCATPRLLVCPFNWNQMKDDERIYEYWIMIIMEIRPSRAEAQKLSKTNCHRHSTCVTSMTRNYMMKGFPPLQVNSVRLSKHLPKLHLASFRFISCCGGFRIQHSESFRLWDISQTSRKCHMWILAP